MSVTPTLLANAFLLSAFVAYIGSFHPKIPETVAGTVALVCGCLFFALILSI